MSSERVLIYSLLIFISPLICCRCSSCGPFKNPKNSHILTKFLLPSALLKCIPEYLSNFFLLLINLMSEQKYLIRLYFYTYCDGTKIYSRVSFSYSFNELVRTTDLDIVFDRKIDFIFTNICSQSINQ